MLVEQTVLIDPSTRLPIAVIDTSSLNGALPDEHTIRKSIQQLPTTDYVLIFFASHSPKVTLQWMQRANKLIDRDVRKRIQRLYLVHETFLYRTLQKALGNLMSPKFAKKVVYIKTLTELAQHCDITLLNISRDIYLHNLNAESHIVVPKHSQPIYGFPIDIGADFFPQVLDFLYVAPLTPKSFEKTGGSELVWVLKQAFDRNQTIDLTEYGPQLVIAAFKLFLFELPEPLVPIDTVPLPIKETPEYWQQVRQLENWREIEQLSQFFAHASKVYHIDVKCISESFGPAICGLVNPGKDNAMVCTRFARLLAMGSTFEPVGSRSPERMSIAVPVGLGIAPKLSPIKPPKPGSPIRSPSPMSRSVSASSAITPISLGPALDPKRTISMPASASPPKPTLMRELTRDTTREVPRAGPTAPKPTAFRRPSMAPPASPLKESTNTAAPREQVTLKPAPPKQPSLKPKPSLRNINGQKLKVGEIAQFYENMSI